MESPLNPSTSKAVNPLTPQPVKASTPRLLLRVLPDTLPHTHTHTHTHAPGSPLKPLSAMPWAGEHWYPEGASLVPAHGMEPVPPGSQGTFVRLVVTDWGPPDVWAHWVVFEDGGRVFEVVGLFGTQLLCWPTPHPLTITTPPLTPM